MFERKVNIPDHGEVLLRFTDFTLMPSRISRRFTGRVESQLWQALAWGLQEPAVWPPPKTAIVDADSTTGEPGDAVEVIVPEVIPANGKRVSTAIEDGIFDDVTIREVMKIHNEWQNAAEVTEGE